MTRPVRDVLVVVLYVLAGLLGAGLAGFITIGGVMFRFPLFLVRFLLLGLTAALIHASVRTGRPGQALTMVAILYLGYLVSSNPINAGTALDALIRALPVGAALFGAACLFRALRRMFMGKFLVMGILLGLAHAVIAAILLPKFAQQFDIGVVLDQGLAGLRLGALVGFGLEVVDFVEGRLPAAEEAR